MEQTQICRSRPGPKPDPLRAQLRASFDAWSDRTFDTWWKGFTMQRQWVIDGLMTHEEKVELAEAIQKKILRPNGTFSVSKFLKYVIACDRELREYDLGHDEAPDQVDDRGLDVSGSASAMSTLEESS